MPSISAYADWLNYAYAEFQISADFLIYDDWYAANIADYPSGPGSYADIFTVLSTQTHYQQDAYEGSNATPMFYNGYPEGLIAGPTLLMVALYTPKGIYWPEHHQYYPRIEPTTIPEWNFLDFFFIRSYPSSDFLVDGVQVGVVNNIYPGESQNNYETNFIGVLAGDFSLYDAFRGPEQVPSHETTFLPYGWEYLRAVIRDMSGCICDCNCCAE